MTRYALGSLTNGVVVARVVANTNTLSFADGPNQGRVVSVQIDGSVESRDPGTAGPSEVCCFSGNGWVSYDPAGLEGVAGSPQVFYLIPLPGS